MYTAPPMTALAESAIGTAGSTVLGLSRPRGGGLERTSHGEIIDRGKGRLDGFDKLVTEREK